MALWLCLDCSAAYAVGQSRCPNCRSTDYIEEGAMPKITIHGGPTNDAAPRRSEWVGEAGPELLNLPDGATVLPAPEEESSPGTSSETSSPKAASSQKPSSSGGRSRARTTGSPSSKGRTATSTAPGTDGAPEDDASATADSEERS